MATPIMLKMLDDKKQAAQKRREQQQQDQLLPLSGMANAPSAHLLVSGNPNPAPRMMDLRPLSSQQFTQYRQPNKDQQQQRRQPAAVSEFALDMPSGHNFTDFDNPPLGAATGSAFHQHIYLQQQQPMSYPNHPQPLQPLQQSRPFRIAPQYGGHHNYNYYDKPNNTNRPIRLRQQKVETLPDGLPTFEVVVRPDNLVCFQGKGHFLSTLQPVSLILEGHQYESVEHYYQACKIFTLLGPDKAQLLRTVQDPLRAKVRAKDILAEGGVANEEVEHWKNTAGILVLLHAIRHKFNQSAELRAKLLATGDAILCQTYDRDSFYAVGMNEQQLRSWAAENEGKVLKIPTSMTFDNVKYLPIVGNGKNVLGVLCMQVRNEIRNKSGDEQSKQSDKEGTERATASASPAASDFGECSNSTLVGTGKENNIVGKAGDGEGLNNIAQQDGLGLDKEQQDELLNDTLDSLFIDDQE